MNIYLIQLVIMGAFTSYSTLYALENFKSKAEALNQH
jgi:hypothetical protein